MNIAKIDGTPVSSEQMVSWLKLTGRFPDVASDLIQEKLSATAARKRGLTISDEELQNAVDNHRRLHGLYKVSDANAFLDSAGLSLEDYEGFIEDGLLAAKMMKEVASDSEVAAHFEITKAEYDAVEIGHIVVDSEGKAEEIMALTQEGAASFQDLAKEQSLVPTGAEGGLIGTVYRGTLAGDLEAKIFNAQVNEVLGPIALEGGNFEVFAVFDRKDAELDEETSAMIRQRLCDQWLESAAREHGVEA